MGGKLLIVGFGPGSVDHMTKRAREAIEESDVIIGYKTYIELVRDLIAGKEIISTGMTEEVSRAQAAVKWAERGKTVAVISSGDAGLYGMAGLVYEVLIEKGWTKDDPIEVEVIPGISAIHSCAALLGAPVMHDACTISLSDHLTPWALIEKRLEAAAAADFVIALYNPKSGRRTRQIVEAQRILLRHRAPETPVGLVKSAYRERQQIVLTDLAHMLDHEIGMLTTVIIGNSTTFVHDGLMITPRGYQRKYHLTAAVQPLKPHERLRKEAEPWALESMSPQATGDVEGKRTAVSNNRASLALAGIPPFPDETQQTAARPASMAGSTAVAGQTAVERPVVHIARQQAKEAAEDALAALESRKRRKAETVLFEAAVSPGVANKQFTAEQLLVLAETVGPDGKMTYTPDHYIKIERMTDDPDGLVAKLTAAGLTVTPVGEVLTVKACDFCDGEKKDAIPYAEELARRFGGMALPKELKLGINGCGMACYGAVREDIGLVYRKGKFDLFLGGKTVGRNAHPGQLVAEGLPPEEIVAIMTEVIEQYKEHAYPNERFHKFFSRVKQVGRFRHEEAKAAAMVETAACGD
ncbi:cobalt-precorrin-3B C(17)-methyltransferase [Geobacillus subterraneus]|uniref:Cobalt-precorrin-3B C(17)-methyltransferase n=2 Tax=Geobacillus TaxID=129337 RepID=A0ABN4NM48_9BACL|nr:MULTISPECIES: precorrin-3B C(17)-methyltransferase [Geobacillus]AMX83530.1 cobalt-precorrin-3B C(17)-methyltransferase [Geobacillus subterraneus]KZS25044.1 cobalt-precorrin-3B C(17)-methyltransferase [Geobacillus subterraneus]OXB87762.1 precorrin-3B C(17)-methyltransferase [Geobacillus uzenensis]